jgi:hypothetical protein
MELFNNFLKGQIYVKKEDIPKLTEVLDAI